MFYDKNSWIAQANIKAVKARGGILSLADLATYKAVIRTPASINYRGYKLFSTVAPSSGTIALSALNILNGYNLSYVEQNGVKTDSNLTTHRIIESMKVCLMQYRMLPHLTHICLQFAYGQRTVLGDPEFVKNVTGLEFHFLTPQVGADIRKNLSDTSTGPPSVRRHH